MYHSLIEVLAKVPPDTALWCGHEYTVANMEFAASIGKYRLGLARVLCRALPFLVLLTDGIEFHWCCAEPDNPAVQRKLQWARAQREQRQPTVPSTIQVSLAKPGLL